jgi:hypothetical protein
MVLVTSGCFPKTVIRMSIKPKMIPHNTQHKAIHGKVFTPANAKSQVLSRLCVAVDPPARQYTLA